MTHPVRTEHLADDVARWLVGDGLEAVADAARALDDGASALAAGERLRARGLGVEHAAAAMDAASARRRARGRWARADAMLLTSAGLEQASDPAVSAWRAARFAGSEPVADLGCGLGGDALAIAVGAPVIGVDLDVARLRLARHNATVAAADVAVLAGDALRAPVRTELVHADPGRRREGRRVRRLGDTLPPVDALLAATGWADGHGVVVSPAVDLADPALPDGAEIEFIQLGRRLVEAVVWTGSLRGPGALATATILSEDVPAATTGTVVSAASSLVRTGAPEMLPVGPPGEYLLVPAPALVRARLHERVGAALGAWRLAENRALLSCDALPTSGAPWWETWRVEEVLPGRPAALRRWLRGRDPQPLSLSTHGPGIEVEAFWKALGGQARGPNGRRIHLVRADRAVIALACVPAPMLGSASEPGVALEHG